MGAPPPDPRAADPTSRPPGLLDHVRALWTRAPAWRLLVGSTVALSIAGAATGTMMSHHEAPAPPASTAAETPHPAQGAASGVPPATATNETACNYRGPDGSGGQGQVVGFLTREQAAALLARSQAATGAAIDPDYVGNPRVIITLPAGRRLVVIAPAGLVVKPGDRVAFEGYHRDWRLPCNYVPNLITGMLPPP